ncbi:MAG: hypothetical protein ACE5L6_01290 [Candidatus Bathyarchaeia archaeon]
MADYVDRGLKRFGVTISKPILAIICIILGIIVILLPKLLVWIVGLFLMIQGALMLTDISEQERSETPLMASKSVYCSSCGTSNMKEALYCRKCGERLEQANPDKV